MSVCDVKAPVCVAARAGPARCGGAGVGALRARRHAAAAAAVPAAPLVFLFSDAPDWLIAAFCLWCACALAIPRGPAHPALAFCDVAI